MINRRYAFVFREPRLTILVDQALASGQNFSIVVFGARALPLEQFSALAYVLLAVLFLASFQQGLVSTPSMTLFPMLGARGSVQYVKVLFVLHICVQGLSAVIFVLYMIVGPFFTQGLETHGVLVPACAYLAGRLYQDLCRRIHLARGKIERAVISDFLLLSCTWLGLLVARSLHTTELTSTLYVLAAASFCTSQFPFRYLSTSFDNDRFITTLRRHLRSGLWLSATSMLTIFGGTLVQLVAGAELGAVALAGLRACANISSFVNLLILSIENYLPRIAAIGLKDVSAKQLYDRIVVRTVSRLVPLFSIIWIFFHFLSGVIMSTLYGEHFREFSNAASLFILIPFLGGLALPAAIFLRTFERPRTLFNAYIFSISPVIPLSLLLIRPFGVDGAISVLMLSQLAYFVYVHFQSARLRALSP